MVAGVVALMLEANKALTWRDVQYILAQTSTKIDGAGAEWTVNAAGYHHSYRYGFGLINALAAVTAAQSWRSVAAPTLHTTHTSIHQRIPPDASVISSSINISSHGTLEHVEVVFDAAHQRATELRIMLTAPSGTTSLLADMRGYDRMVLLQATLLQAQYTMQILAVPSLKGPSFPGESQQPMRAPLLFSTPLTTGCTPYGQPSTGNNTTTTFAGAVAIVYRGDCSFTTKVAMAQQAGAIAILVVNVDDELPPMVVYEPESTDSIPLAMMGASDASMLSWYLSQNHV